MNSPLDRLNIVREAISKLQNLVCDFGRITEGKEPSPEITSIIRVKSEVEASLRNLENDLHQIHVPAFCQARVEEKRRDLREKLDKSAQRIRERTVQVSEPFQLSCDDKIWEKVLLEYTTQDPEVTSFYFACSTFHRILEEKRITHFFPKILYMFQENERRVNRFGHLEALNYLGSRSVSRNFKKAADNAIFETSDKEKVWFDSPKRRMLSLESGANVCIFKTAEAVLKAKELLHQFAGKNLPLLRTLYVEKHLFGQTPDDNVAFEEKILEFLDLFGASVWYFSYKESFPFQSFGDRYPPFRRMIERMPNLKALTFQHVSRVLEDMDEPAAELMEMEALLTENPFPPLPSLKYLHAIIENDLFLGEIFKQCKNLTSVRHEKEAPEEYNESFLTEIQKLSLERFECCMDVFILLSRRVIWPMKTLIISNSGWGKESTLWPALNMFSGTLEYLDMDGVGVLRDNSGIILHLPRLKFLRIVFNTETVGLDDILHLKSLETLFIKEFRTKTMGPRTQEENNALVKIFGMIHRMEASNIWHCFPNLKEFRIYNDVKYIRSGATLSRYSIKLNPFYWKLENVCPINEMMEIEMETASGVEAV